MTDQQDPKHSHDQISEIHARLDKGSERMRAIEQEQTEMHDELRRNTAATERYGAVTEEMRDLFELGKAGLRVLGWLGAAVKWAAPVVAAVVGIWHLIHGGDAPK